MPNYDVASYNIIYVYSINDEQHRGLLKIGKASFSSPDSIAQLTANCPRLKQVADQRISQQTRTALVPYELLHTELAVKTITMRDGSRQIQAFDDHDVHDVLLNSNFTAKRFVESGRLSEWYEVDLDTAVKAIQCVKSGLAIIPNPARNVVAVPQMPVIKLRKEQEENVAYTIDIFKRYDTMLWDCKMRYGKTITAYELIKRQGYKKVIVITHRPAVEDGWGSDHKLMFNGIRNEFIDKTNTSTVFDTVIDADNDRKLKQLVQSNTPFVYFTSIQDLRGSKRVGGKHNKNNGVFDMQWDLLIIDEAHEGTATPLGDAVISNLRKPTTKVLSLSGTPYNIMGEFEENKYTWTYVDEQKAKATWDEEHPEEKNPYEDLPKLNIFTFDLTEQMPTSYRYVTEESAFNFREFFRVWTGDIERDFYPIPSGFKVGDFVHYDDVNSFLDLISKESNDSNYPFSTDEYRDMFAHTFWIVPGVKEAKALSSLMKAHPKFSDFEIVNIAGDGDEEKPYDEALALVKSSIKNFDKTITISCGKLTTGVTVREWTGIMMLSGSSSTAAAGYMQAIFRVQSPGCINGKQKRNCYVFDFAPDRTLKVIAEVHSVTHKGTQGDDSAKQALGEFINFCPVIAIDGTMMRTYDVNEMMRQIKRISIDAAINSGFEDDTIYVSDAGMNMSDVDVDILRKLTDVVVPQKKGKRRTEVTVNDVGLSEEKRKLAEKAKRKPKKELTPEEKEALELYKQQKEEQKKLYNLLRAVSIRLPLLFYGADADITEIIRLKNFVDIVDDESWKEFMPHGLKKELFLDILKYYDEDVVVAAGLRIRKMAKAADELPPTLRAKRIVEIISKFKNPDKETVLTPWHVVNMHMGDTVGGYNFFDEKYHQELEEPRMIDGGEVSANIFLNPDSKVLEVNSKSGLYPLYLAYTFYMLNVTGKEKDLSLEETQKIWFDILKKHIFVLCKTKMARMITKRTLVGYLDSSINAIYLTKLVDERLKDIPRLVNKLSNPVTWNMEGVKLKFDAVVGNPPYQENIGTSGNDSLAKQLFPDFIKLSIMLDAKYASLITPSRWFTAEAQDKSFLRLREFLMENNHFSKICHYANNKILFKDVEIAGGVNYYLYEKDYVGDVEFVECSATSREMVERPLFEDGSNIVIAMNKSVSIMRRITSHADYSPLSDWATGRNAFGIVGKEEALIRISKDKPEEGYVQIVCAHEVVKYVKEELVQKNTHIFNSWKILTSKANGGAGLLGDDRQVSIIGKSYVAGPKVCCTDSLIPIGCFETEVEAINLQKYMKTKFLRYLAGILKTSQNLYQGIYRFVPVQDFTNDSDINWAKAIHEIDAQLYHKYALSQEEIQLIEDKIKPME